MNTLSTVPEVDLSQVRMAIYWKALGELDVYTSGKVKTICGDHIELVMTALRNQRIPVEVME